MLDSALEPSYNLKSFITAMDSEIDMVNDSTPLFMLNIISAHRILIRQFELSLFKHLYEFKTTTFCLNPVL